jgi:hypothetical protein
MNVECGCKIVLKKNLKFELKCGEMENKIVIKN